jgi:hypothetical protein
MKQVVSKPSVLLDLWWRFVGWLRWTVTETSAAITDTKGSKGKRFQIVFTVLVLAIIGYEFARHWGEIKNYPWRLNYVSLSLTFVAYTGVLWLALLCWRSIMIQLSGYKPLHVHFRIYFMTTVAKRLPTPIWYTGARIFGYEGIGVAKSVTAMAIGLEIMVHVFSGLALGLIFSAVGPFWSVIRESPWVSVVALPFIVLMLRPAWLIKLANWGLRRVRQAEISVVFGFRNVAVWCLYYFGVWTCGAGMIFLITNSIYPVSWQQFPAMLDAWAISGVVGMLGQVTFLTLAGFGVRQAMLAYLLSYSIPWPVAIAVALLSRLLVPIYESTWALIASRT